MLEFHRFAILLLVLICSKVFAEDLIVCNFQTLQKSHIVKLSPQSDPYEVEVLITDSGFMTESVWMQSQSKVKVISYFEVQGHYKPLSQIDIPLPAVNRCDFIGPRVQVIAPWLERMMTFSCESTCK